MRSREISLIFPPHVIPTGPYLSTALLKAYLEERGHRVRQVDCNLGWYDAALSASHLDRVLDEIERLIQPLEQAAELSPAEACRLRRLVEAVGDGRYAVSRIEDAKAILRSRRFYDPVEFRWANELIATAFRSLSARWYPTELGIDSLRSRWSPFSASETLAFAESRDENPYRPYLRRVAADLVDRSAFVGISVAFPDQVLPAQTLAMLVKELDASVFVCLGGNFYSRVVEGLANAPDAFRYADAIVVGEGEVPLASLVESDEAPEETPGVATFNGRYRYTPASATVHARDLPTPNFDGLDLAAYFIPEVVLPTLTFKGCSYGRCTFCDHHVNYATVSARTASKVSDDLRSLNARYGVSHFNFVDEEMPPGHAEAIAEELAAHGPGQIYWMGYAIYRKSWTRSIWEKLWRSGCREMLFGFESASPDVLKSMDKNLSLKVVRRITDDLNDVGIASRVNVIVGFPGETVSQSRTTLDFFLAEQERFDRTGTLVAFHPFLLVRNAPLARMPLGRAIALECEDEPLRLHLEYDVQQAGEMLDRVDEAVDADAAYRLAHRYSGVLSETYGRSPYPTWRPYRFLYICERDARPLPRNRKDPRNSAGDASIDTRDAEAAVILSAYDLGAVEPYSAQEQEIRNTYRHWSNFRSSSAALQASLSGAGRLRRRRPLPYMRINAVAPNGGLISVLRRAE